MDRNCNIGGCTVRASQVLEHLVETAVNFFRLHHDPDQHQHISKNKPHIKSVKVTFQRDCHDAADSHADSRVVVLFSCPTSLRILFVHLFFTLGLGRIQFRAKKKDSRETSYVALTLLNQPAFASMAEKYTFMAFFLLLFLLLFKGLFTI